MVESTKLLTGFNRFLNTGYETREDAEHAVRSLRDTYEIGWGFWLVNPVELADDGTWKFTWSRGSSCD